MLRCPKCGGRFLVDPGLPPDAFVQNFAGEPPPIQNQNPDASTEPAPDPWTEIGAASPRPRRRYSWEDDPPAASDAPGWTWFVVLLVLEVVIGILWAEIRSRAALDLYFIVFLGPYVDATTRGLVYLFRAAALVHEGLMIAALFWAASHARRNGTSIAPWLLPILFLQSLGLGLYLVGRPRVDCGTEV